MKKRITITACFCLVIAFIFTACSKGPELPESEEYPASTSQYSYNSLESDEAQRVYRRLATSMYSDPDGDNILEEFGDIDTSQFYLGFRAYTDDHPEVFWDQIGYTTSGLTVKGMNACSRYSKKQLKEMKVELNEEIEEFLDAVPSGLSQEELEEFTHDYLVENCEYDYDALAENENKDIKEKSDSTYLAGTSYGALVNGKAVCEGYARAYQLLLNRVGVDCVMIFGKSEPKKDTEIFDLTGSTHAWNAVKNGATWLMTDVTWDDGSNSLQYFNIPIDKMYEDHTAKKISQDKFKYSVHFNTYGASDCIFLPE